MKSKVIVLTLAALFSVSGLAIAQDMAASSEAAPAAAVEQAKPAAVEVGNTKCPVCGMDIPKEFMGKYTVEYNGKVYNTCSPNDRDMFNADLEKYGQMAEATMGTPAAEPVKTEEAVPAAEQK